MGELAVDLGDAAVLGIAEPAHQGHDVETELVIGQGEVGLSLGAVGSEEAGAGGIGAASDGQGQPEDAVEGADSAKVVVVGAGPMLALGTVQKDRSEGQVAIRLRSWSSSFEVTHGKPPLLCSYVHYTKPRGCPATFATLVKNTAKSRNRPWSAR